MGWPSQAMKGKLVISYVYSNNHNAANKNDLSLIPPGSRDYKFPNPESRDWKQALGLQSLISCHLVEISSAVTAVLSVKCEQTDIIYITLPTVTICLTSAQRAMIPKRLRAWHSIYNSWQHRRWDGGLFGWHLTAAVVWQVKHEAVLIFVFIL